MKRFLVIATAVFFIASAAVAGNDEIIEVKAKLTEIPGKLPPDDLYDYAYVMKYEVLEGSLKGKTIFVAHYKPRLKRSKIKDKMKKHVGGSLKKFKEGDVHKLVLDPNLKKIWKGPVTDDYFSTDRSSTRYWCLKANPS